MNKCLWIALCASLVAGCGGGSSGSAPAAATVPASDIPVAATQDSTAALDFVAGVAASTSESADPLTIGDASLATSDTDDAKPL